MIAIYASLNNGREPGKKLLLDRVYDAGTQERLAHDHQFLAPFTDLSQLEERKAELQTVEAMFTTWGTPTLSQEQLSEFFPNLKYVFYAAGSVQYFARPYFAHGARIFSAADANSIPVIEYTLAQILLATKGFYQAARLYSGGNHTAARKYSADFPGNYGETVGIIGAGKIGRGVIEALRPYRLKVLVFDPFLPEEAAKQLGVTLCGLEELFEKSFVVSNHLANNEQTQGMLHYTHFSKLRHGAAFINTGRGAQVVEADLVRALKEDPSRTAVLDVTDPEPVEPGHDFYSMENVFLTPHIAGSIGDEVARMGEFMAEQWEAVRDGKPAVMEVTEAMLETMA